MKEIYTPECCLDSRSAVGTFGAMALALAPKLVYFPILGILLLMPRSKFSSPVTSRLYRGAACILAIMSFLAFVLPFLSSTGAATDIRGGSDVNASEQLVYILNNPLDVVVIFFKFYAQTYLPATFPHALLDYSYLGMIAMPYLVCVLLFIASVTLTDSKRGEKRFMSPGGRIWSFFTIICAIMLATLGLYICFTSVRAQTVSGFQGRYLFPVLFPFLCLCIPAIKNKFCSKRVYGLSVLGLSALLIFACNVILISEGIAI